MIVKWCCFIGFAIVTFLAEGSFAEVPPSKPGRVPFVVSLEGEGGAFCSGSIVDPRWILTMASCVWNKSPMEFSVAIQPESDYDSSGHHERVRKVFLHPDYRKRSTFSNVALLYLSRPITWNDRLVSIDISSELFNPSKQQKCILIGWERDRFNGDFQSEQIEFLPLEQCRSKNSRTNVCLNGSKTSICEFRNGSPLLCKRTGSQDFEQVAIFSGWKGCLQDARHRSWELFVATSEYLGWINETLDGAASREWWSSSSGGPASSSEAVERNYSVRLSQFNWMIVAVSFFMISVTIFIKVLRSGFKL
ncbi:chymotrypsin-like elastase family member 1 [Uranotaenia lowii]|uniref:chymotrypsin-like elastase family member 1 n=1 Tax=Uranotaenia lowii TaxID=190385 RepID=UPI0024788B1D|nr:chymotrypsin-like elastase family member 1 [Uranotaenia lowii]